MGFERDKILFVGEQEILQLGGVVFSGKRVGVIAIGQQDCAYIQSFPQNHVDSAQGGFDSGTISIINDGYILCKTADQANLPFGEGGTGRGNHIFNSRLVH